MTYIKILSRSGCHQADLEMTNEFIKDMDAELIVKIIRERIKEAEKHEPSLENLDVE